jgi:hypothetical protein
MCKRCIEFHGRCCCTFQLHQSIVNHTGMDQHCGKGRWVSLPCPHFSVFHPWRHATIARALVCLSASCGLLSSSERHKGCADNLWHKACLHGFWCCGHHGCLLPHHTSVVSPACVPYGFFTAAWEQQLRLTSEESNCHAEHLSLLQFTPTSHQGRSIRWRHYR